jgi:hypothetical protein
MILVLEIGKSKRKFRALKLERAHLDGEQP